MVADRLEDHLRYQHGAPRTRCDHCEGPLNPDGSASYGKRFCRGSCQTLNHRALVKARRVLAELKAALSDGVTQETDRCVVENVPEQAGQSDIQTL